MDQLNHIRHSDLFLRGLSCNLQEMAPDLRRRVDIARETRLAREAEMRKQVDAQVGFWSYSYFCDFSGCSAAILILFISFAFSPIGFNRQGS